MVDNKIAVFIDGRNVTRYVVLPLKLSQIVDEQLDEGVLSMRNCPIKVIAPLTPVEIRITNTVTMRGNQVYQKSSAQYFVVANQPESDERPVGSGRYDHDLRIIEVTKCAERVIVDSITYTNELGRAYANENTPPAEPVWIT